MGFGIIQIDNLLENEVIEDSNAAVEMLIKGPNGWVHKYRKHKFDDIKICVICDDYDTEHVDVKIRLEEQRIRYLHGSGVFADDELLPPVGGNAGQNNEY